MRSTRLLARLLQCESQAGVVEECAGASISWQLHTLEGERKERDEALDKVLLAWSHSQHSGRVCVCRWRFAVKVLQLRGDELPPSIDGLLQWSLLFRNPERSAITYHA